MNRKAKELELMERKSDSSSSISGASTPEEMTPDVRSNSDSSSTEESPPVALAHLDSQNQLQLGGSHRNLL